MYDRHKPIIKWYEYDASKLYQTADAEDVAETNAAAAVTEEAVPADNTGALTDAVEAAGGADAPLTGSELDDEVARIMAAFSGAKQNGVDDVFAMMAAEVEAGGSIEGSNDPGDAAGDDAGSGAVSEEEELLASILAPRQNGVDDLVAKAREG